MQSKPVIPASSSYPTIRSHQGFSGLFIFFTLWNLLWDHTHYLSAPSPLAGWMSYFQFRAVVTWCWCVLVHFSQNTGALILSGSTPRSEITGPLGVPIFKIVPNRFLRQLCGLLPPALPSGREARSFLCIFTDNTSLITPSLCVSV